MRTGAPIAGALLLAGSFLVGGSGCGEGPPKMENSTVPKKNQVQVQQQTAPNSGKPGSGGGFSNQ